MNLSNKITFFKYNYWHMFAHKPLCEKYKNEVIKIRNVFLCRSCTLLYLGLFAGLFIKTSALFFAVAFTVICLLSTEKIYKSFNRRVRDFLRFTLGFLITNMIHLLISLNFAGFYGVITFSFGCHYYFKKRKKRKLRECSSCLEVSSNKICSGFERQAPSIRRFQEELTKIAYRKRGIDYEFE